MTVLYEITEASGEVPHIMELAAPADEVPALIHEVAEFFERNPNNVLIGMWSTGFGQPWEITLQVVYTVEKPLDGQ